MQVVTFVQTYGKEIVSVLVPILTWALNRFGKGKARLEIAQPHTFTFLVNEPLVDAQGNVLHPNQTVETNSILVRNTGRETTRNLELVFNWKPKCVNIWPPRHYETKDQLDGRHVLKFDSLSPDESIGCEVLSINGKAPALLTARSDECVAKVVPMFPQPVIAPAARNVLRLLVAVGLAAAVYGAIVLVQFLVLKTPLG